MGESLQSWWVSMEENEIWAAKQCQVLAVLGSLQLPSYLPVCTHILTYCSQYLGRKVRIIKMTYYEKHTIGFLFVPLRRIQLLSQWVAVGSFYWKSSKSFQPECFFPLCDGILACPVLRGGSTSFSYLVARAGAWVMEQLTVALMVTLAALPCGHHGMLSLCSHYPCPQICHSSLKTALSLVNVVPSHLSRLETERKKKGSNTSWQLIIFS